MFVDDETVAVVGSRLVSTAVVLLILAIVMAISHDLYHFHKGHGSLAGIDGSSSCGQFVTSLRSISCDMYSEERLMGHACAHTWL